MKIYTKLGDGGETTLASGHKVSKADDRVTLYGMVDELNSLLGFGLSQLPEDLATVKVYVEEIQSLLFELGSELAGHLHPGKQATESILESSDLTKMEKQIDQLSSELPELKNFILPGGHPSAGIFHLARTQCRNLERSIVHFKNSGGGINSLTIPFVNRLSDYLFTVSRYTNAKLGISEPIWKSRTKS